MPATSASGHIEIGASPESLDETEITADTRIGLALSGGGAKGFAHLGFIKVLEEIGMPIDYISGTSMGALVGGLYAMGYTSEQLQELATSLNWDDLFSDAIRRRHIPMEEKEWDSLYLVSLPIIGRSISLPSGVVAGHRIGLLLNQLTWRYPGPQNFLEFPIPFVCVATDLETGEPVVLSEGFPAEAIRASISIPTIFMPKTIDDRILVDGGVVRNLPVEEVLELGADIVLAVNVSDPLKSADELFNIIDIMDQTVSFQIVNSIRHSQTLADLNFEDSDITDDYGVLDFDEAEALIELGKALARSQIDELQELADQINEARGRPTSVPRMIEEPMRYYISDIRITGIESASEVNTMGRFMLQNGNILSKDDIQLGIENVYGSQFFSSITYRLIPDSDYENHDEAFVLELVAVERVQDMFRFGFYYDNYRRASLLLNTTFRNLFYASSVTRINFKLGEEPSLDLRFFNYLRSEYNNALALRANYSLHVIDEFNSEGVRTSTFNTNAVFLEGMFVPHMDNRAMVSVGLRQEFFNISTRVGEVVFPFASTSISQLIARFDYDSTNRVNFTQKGHLLNLEASQSVDILNTAVNFFQASASWQGYFELNDELVFLTGARLGTSTRSELPQHWRFRFGGYPDYPGFRIDEINSNNIRILQAGIRYEFLPGYYASFRSSMGSTERLDEFNFSRTPLRIGWGVGFGFDTRIAPIQAAIMGSQRNPIMIMYSVGIPF
ncbi:patatin-like phospholipase family protein [Cyclonatronum proteinivorum]|uniref:patatin-like phospholipase family protein n=1 Tax=Cyclonatronum proteinivorum TaxID=1457365 RepID=UPI0013DF1682|nr:patatin-like phospholipase family protein [Cyclonatronum proteinivorum]